MNTLRKKSVGFTCCALLILALLVPPAGLFAKTPARKEVSRIRITVTVPTEPDPTGACSGSIAHCVTLTWTAPTAYVGGAPITGTLSYDVFRSTTSGSGYTKLTTAQVTVASFEDDSVVGGTTYFYVVVAYVTLNGSLSAASSNSAETSATGLPVPPPNPPTGLQAVSH